MNYSNKPEKSYLLKRHGHFTTKTLRLATQILSRDRTGTTALFPPDLPESYFVEVSRSQKPPRVEVPYSRPVDHEPPTPTFVNAVVMRPNDKGVLTFAYQFSGRVCGVTTPGLYVRDLAHRPDARPEWLAYQNIRPFHQN